MRRLWWFVKELMNELSDQNAYARHLAFHGVAPIADGEHALMGRQRINLTFRKAR